MKGVTNKITIKETEDQIEKKAIEHALRRNWFIDDKNIKVNVSGHKVTLTGSVNSWYQFDKAARIAWNAPGVWKLDNKSRVDYDY